MLLHDEPRGLAALVRMAQVLLDLAQGPQFSNAELDVAADDQRAGELLRLFDRARPHDHISTRRYLRVWPHSDRRP
ncbi:hypothetical protein [Achromobacter dolens]|uniref:hypothetical protein n=1 Tax=Achromobacter dolens TaxID=1287738 RepID=UPI0006C8D12D|nr:hypothetical protein [Achromobacter dolens]MCZ8410975.1 hypothetical protein [Achromobacter dolens]